jgi:peptidyl-prolyl cis-trans isomerase C
MKFFRSILAFGAACVVLPGQTPPPNSPPPMPQVKLEMENPGVKPPVVPPDRVIITVGDVKITAGQFDQLIETLAPQYRTMARGTGRKQFADNVVQMIVLGEEAQKRKLDQTVDYKTRAMFQHFNLMAGMLVDQIGKDLKVSDDDVRKYYEDHKADYETIHAKHILIRYQGSQVPVRPGQKDLSDADAQAKAQEIHKKLVAGGDFGELAKQESDDVGTGANGGELPPFKKGQMVPNFEAAAFALKPGGLSEPVKTQFGYHIIQVVSHDTKSFEDVRGELESKVKPDQTQKAVAKEIENLQKANPPVLDPDFFPPDKPAAPKGPDNK